MTQLKPERKIVFPQLERAVIAPFASVNTDNLKNDISVNDVIDRLFREF